MKWEEFLNTEVDDVMLNDIYNAVKTDIECPDCGRPIYMNNTVLIGLPAQYRYWCVCGWNDHTPLKWKNEIHNTSTVIEREDN